MSMNGFLLQVSPELCAHLRHEPALAAKVALGRSLAALGDPGDMVDMADAALTGCGPLGWAARCVPRFVRRWVLGRLLRRSLPPPPAVPPGLSPARLRRLAEQGGDPARVARVLGAQPRRPRLRLVHDAANPAVAEAAEHAEYAEQEEAAPDELPEGVGELLTLGKDWHLVHTLLTGTAGEAEGPQNAVLGGEEIGEDLGYGPARLLGPAEAAAVAEHLGGIKVARLMKAWDPASFARMEVYGADFAEEEGARAEIEAALGRMQRFYRAVRRQGSGVLLWLS